MGRPISFLTISLVAAAMMQIASLESWQVAVAETSDDEDVPTREAIAMSAGTTAGLIEACGVDVAPIESAFKEFLAQTSLASSSQRSLVEKFKAAEDTALSTLANAPASSCASTTGLMREAIHSLTTPAL